MLVALDARLDRVAHAWIARLSASRALREDAAAFVARAAGEGSVDAVARVLRKTRYELDMLFARILSLDPATLHVCRRLLEEEPSPRPRIGPHPVARMIAGEGASPLPILAALQQIVPAEATPALMLVPDPQHAHHETADVVAAAVQALAGVALAAPLIPVALGIQPAQLRAYHDVVAESRAKAMVREGLVQLPPSSSSSASAPPPQAPREGAGLDPARSEPERFLFARLEEAADTRGLFQQNAKVRLEDGKVREIDLCCLAHRVAIEIDGYHHFREPEAYRRDRRKDLSLQRDGFIVVRALAEDVVARLEGIFADIRGAISVQRARRTPPHQG